MIKNAIIEDIEWYNGHQAHSGPRRVKVNGEWYDVHSYERTIREDSMTQQRTVHYHCCLSDGQVIEIIKTQH
jgi:hypothetical protein